jgi:hypothetical protein
VADDYGQSDEQERSKVLTVNLRLEKAARGEYMDQYYAQEGDWFFQVHVPKHSRPPALLDVHFAFLQLPYRVEWYGGRDGRLRQMWFPTQSEAYDEAKRRNGIVYKEADSVEGQPQ